MKSYQSLLVVLVPEAKQLVKSFCDESDPSASDGMPAHLTINFPFLPGRSVASED
ncbi:MAG: hypothetical protein P1R58_09360 [bacterium]|nr:hypothetical protein [bacterium]